MRPPTPPRIATQTRAPLGDPYILDPEEFSHVVEQLGDPRTSSQKRETLLRLIGIDTAQPLSSEVADADTNDVDGVDGDGNGKEIGEKEKDGDKGKEGKGEVQLNAVKSDKHQSDSAVPRRLPGTPGPMANQLEERPDVDVDVDVDAKKRARSSADDDEADIKGSKAQTDQDQTDDTRPAKVARPCARERLMS